MVAWSAPSSRASKAKAGRGYIQMCSARWITAISSVLKGRAYCSLCFLPHRWWHLDSAQRSCFGNMRFLHLLADLERWHLPLTACMRVSQAKESHLSTLTVKEWKQYIFFCEDPCFAELLLILKQGKIKDFLTTVCGTSRHILHSEELSEVFTKQIRCRSYRKAFEEVYIEKKKEEKGGRITSGQNKHPFERSSSIP